MIDEFLRYLPLVNLAIVPAALGVWRIAGALLEIRHFMAESVRDRADLRRKIEPIERELLARGFLRPQ